MKQQNIRNFAIIAHVDHGKSTLADRLLEITGTVSKSKMREQFLDSSPISRERGITIKLAPVRMLYKIPNSKSEILNKFKIQNSNDQNELENDKWQMENKDSEYILNLIDTPGHVDFSYEVSRTLACCEGVILLVDATQGIQAQTLSHGLSALELGLTIIPVINKVDLPQADIEKSKKELMETFGFVENEILLASAKSGIGIPEIIQAVIERIPSPKQDVDKPLRALIFDSFFDTYKGVVAQVKIVEGTTPNLQLPIHFLGTKAEGYVLETGYFTPTMTAAPKLQAGEIGYIATGLKEADAVRVGDTIVTDVHVHQLAGYKEVKPMVFVGLYPIDSSDYLVLKDALYKFRLSDPAFSFVVESSSALGAGFRCGFLGLLHAEVVQERLQTEYSVDVLATAPSVEYLVDGQRVNNPSDLDFAIVREIQEPWILLQVFTPKVYIGALMDLVQEKRGAFLNMEYHGIQVELRYEMPLSEMITNFYDRLKSVSSGYASIDYTFLAYRVVDAVRVDILVGGEKVDALATIVYRPQSVSIGRRFVEKLKDILPRQNFPIALQAAIGGTIIARETIEPFRKDVTQKLYGGDRTRKDKLLDKQKKGKKKMKMIGRVEIPQEAFLTLLKS